MTARDVIYTLIVVAVVAVVAVATFTALLLAGAGPVVAALIATVSGSVSAYALTAYLTNH